MSFDPDPARTERNLGLLLDRIQALEISHVFLQAFADPDGDGAADAVYFPNRHLPMRADLFNRAAWQLKTRSNVKVYAWMPILGLQRARRRSVMAACSSYRNGDQRHPTRTASPACRRSAPRPPRN